MRPAPLVGAQRAQKYADFPWSQNSGAEAETKITSCENSGCLGLENYPICDSSFLRAKESKSRLLLFQLSFRFCLAGLFVCIFVVVINQGA